MDRHEPLKSKLHLPWRLLQGALAGEHEVKGASGEQNLVTVTKLHQRLRCLLQDPYSAPNINLFHHKDIASHWRVHAQ